MRSLASKLGLLFVFIATCVFAQADSTKNQTQPAIPIARRSIKNDRTIPLRDMKPAQTRKGEKERGEIQNRVMPKALLSIRAASRPDTAVQKVKLPDNMPATFQNFDGTDNLCGCLPPDTNGD